ncbi:hypothetical protein PENTCL1PPCAC_11851 [Pristionchus entomophagus]|uniref:Uncharacterized protein n=1 Tax=Pristionchus entomophagus TaxID=358040 RepID=A0AAV5TDJ5_9BILA|nr:hypothetical protein PENTCL1PPCAC_11851 [Pristionchus entomophagus]
MIKCDSQLWLKGDSDEWLRIDGGLCGENGVVQLHKNNRPLNNSKNGSPSVLQCSLHVPICRNDIDLPITILLVYSSIMTIIVIILYVVLYRTLDKCVGPKREGFPSSYSCDSSESRSQKIQKRMEDRIEKKMEDRIKKKMEDRIEKSETSEKQVVKTPMIPTTRTILDGVYENMTIR